MPRPRTDTTGAVVGAATVITPAGPMSDAEVVVEDGRITEVRPAVGPVPDVVLVPGFVDLQVNGIGAVDVAGATGTTGTALDAAAAGPGGHHLVPHHHHRTARRARGLVGRRRRRGAP